jgi:AbrB family looped-hinge helix DNA binding protein
MSTIPVKISSKHQIAVPSAIRKELDLEAGDRLLAQVRDGVIVLVPERGSALDQLRGLHREIWEGDIDAYLDEERNAWDRPNRS